MYEKVGWKIALIILVIGTAFLFTFPPFDGMVPAWMEKVVFGVWPQAKGKLVLGEDLKGGLTMVLSVTNPTERDNVIDVLNRRVNASGLKEVFVSALGDRQLQVRAPAESPGLRDLLMTTGTLEFRKEATEDDYRKYDGIREAAAKAGQPLPPPMSGFMAVENTPGRAGRRYLFLYSRVELTAKDFADFYSTYDENRPVVGFTLASDSAAKFSAVTRELYEEYGNEHGRLAVFVNGALESAPLVNSVISNRGIVTLGGSDIEALGKKQRELLIALKSGALQTPITFESEIKTGPGIGEDSLRRGITSMVLGAALVLMFMLVYYLAAGLVANFCLVLNIILIMGTLSGFQATFTLPGFAGLILTIGMAVDANILIFERIREEKAAGKALAGAVKAGYERAFATILDSNATTLIIGLILWWQGTGPIRGFAITLSVGILASLFTALFVSKVIFTVLVRARAFKEVKMQQWIKRPHFPFMKMCRIPIAVSLIVIACGIGLVSVKGSSLLGIDFLGGAQYQINLTRALSIEDARSRLAEFMPQGTKAEVQSVARLGSTSGAGESYEFIIRFPQQVLDGIASGQGIPPESDPSVKVERVEQLIRDKFGVYFPPAGLTISREESRFSRITFVLTSTNPDNVERLKSNAGTVLQRLYPDRHEVAEVRGASVEVTVDASLAKYRGGELQGILAKIKADLDAEMGTGEFEIANTTDFNADPRPVVVVDCVFEMPSDLTAAQEAVLFERIPAAVTETVKQYTVRQSKDFASEGYKVKDVKTIGRVAGSEDTAKAAGGEETGKKYVKYRLEVECDQNFEIAVQMLTTTLTGQLADKDIQLPDGRTVPVVVSRGGISQAVAITGSVAKDLRYKGFVAFVLAMGGIIFYVWFRFRQFRYGLAAVLALFHDAIITVGILALLDALPFFSFKFDLTVVAALLTIVGYSINDTIVVFDRIRENMGLHREERYFIENIDNSINQTLTRTLWTALTTFVVVFCLAALGGEMIRGFAVTMCIGIIVGTYSSIFIASPVLVWFHTREMRGTPSTAQTFRR